MCIDRKCADCGVKAIQIQLQPALDQFADSMVMWKTWALVSQEIHDRTGAAKSTSRKMLTTTGPLDQVLTELEAELNTFAFHLTNTEWQHRLFASLKLKNKLPHDWVLFCLDFGENFGCYQDEAQGAHWTR